MIRTGQKWVPWHSVILLCCVSGVAHLVESGVGGNPMGFLLSRFTVDPFIASLLTAIAPAMAIMISPYVSWKSDRIWTSWGRRKPFILCGFVISAIALVITPFANSLWMLILMIVVLYVGNDVGYQGPFAPLLYEVVPTSQRGRAAVMKRYATDLAKLTLVAYLIGNWANIYRIADHSAPPVPLATKVAKVAKAPEKIASILPATLPAMAKKVKEGPPSGYLYQYARPAFLPHWFHLELTGAHVLYFTFALIVLITAVAIALGVKETKPHQALPHARFNPAVFLMDLFRDRQMVMVALLLFCGSTLAVALTGYLSTFMLQQQFGYTELDFKNITRWSTIIMTAGVMPIALFTCDRIDRRVLYRWGLLLGTLHHLAMWVMIRVVGVPSVTLWLVMIGLGLLVDTTAGLALEPLVFDMVPREKIGTINSGFLLISKILGMIIAPLIGGFIWCYSFARNGFTRANLKWDYSSGFLVYFALGTIGCVLYYFFVEPQWRTGNLTDLSGGSPSRG